MAITLQDIFNAAVQKFIVEKGEPAVNLIEKSSRYYACKYLTESGHKCAIGLVLPDEHPSQHFLSSFPFLAMQWPELWSQEILDLAKNKSEFLRLFQCRLHDILVDTKTGEWNSSLEERIKEYFRVAHDYKLSIPDSLNEAAARFQ